MDTKFETFEHAGMTCELHYDWDAESPASWDNLGTLVAFDRNIGFAEQNAEYQEREAVERGGSRLLARYIHATSGALIVPFDFYDYGSGGARITANQTLGSHDAPDGFIFTTHERVNELCGTDPQYHKPEWISDALAGELDVWNDYVEGRAIGYVVLDSAGETVDSCWSFYPEREGDGYDYVREQARESAQIEADDRAEKARLWAFGNVELP